MSKKHYAILALVLFISLNPPVLAVFTILFLFLLQIALLVAIVGVLATNMLKFFGIETEGIFRRMRPKT